jgi:uncharacterized protein YjbI with pentapeptide repeats
MNVAIPHVEGTMPIREFLYQANARIQAAAEKYPQLRWAWLANPASRHPSPDSESRPSGQAMEREKDSADELDRTIQRTILAVVAYAFFSVLVIAQPDSNLIVASERVKVPFADVLVDYIPFLLVGQMLMVALATYLHVHIEAAASFAHERLPMLHNQRGIIAIALSFVLAYVVPSIVVSLFAWKSLPIKLSFVTVPVAAAFIASLLFVIIRRIPYYSRPVAVPLLLVLMGLVALVAGCDMRGRFDSVAWPREYNDARFGALMDASSKACGTSEGRIRRTVDLRGVDLRRQDLAARDLTGFDLSGANLSEMHLPQVRLCGARLERANLSRSMLAGARLSRAWMYLVDLQGADLQSAALDSAMLWDTSLRGVFLLNADLRQADLRNASLGCIDLSAPDPRCTSAENANFAGTNLANADIANTDFSNARNLTCEQVRSARWWEQAKGPIIEECKRAN